MIALKKQKKVIILMNCRDEENRVLMVASVASMIDLFNEDNIEILQSLGYQIHVMANFENGNITSNERVKEFKRELSIKGICYTHVPIPRSLYKIKSIIQSYKMIKEEVLSQKYKIVHCHSPIGGVVCRLACRKARKMGTKVIYTAHGFHFFHGAKLTNWLLFYPIERMCAHYTDRLITINKEDFMQASKWNNTKVEYIPGIGIFTDKFMVNTNDREMIRSSLGLNSDDFVLMSTGQISKRKNQEVVVKSLSRINNPHVKYLIVGKGELEEQLKELAKELKVEKQVVFTGYRKDICNLLHAVDLFVFPSLQEGLPVALMEAMASGLPVVCSRIRGNTDLIVNGQGGYLVSPRDINGFSNAIKILMENPNERQEMSKMNMKTIENFDIIPVRKKMTDIYNNII